MRSVLFLAIAVFGAALILGAAPAAMAQQSGGSYQGYSGVNKTAVNKEEDEKKKNKKGEAEKGVPLKMESESDQATAAAEDKAAKDNASAQQNTAATPAPAPQPVVDPCLAYMSSYNAYTVCQDRIQKIQRMQDAKARRTQKPSQNNAQAPSP